MTILSPSCRTALYSKPAGSSSVRMAGGSLHMLRQKHMMLRRRSGQAAPLSPQRPTRHNRVGHGQRLAQQITLGLHMGSWCGCTLSRECWRWLLSLQEAGKSVVIA